MSAPIREIIKSHCQMSGSSFNSMVDDYILEAISLLEQDGVAASSSVSDPVILAAIECHVKAQINYENRGEWFTEQFEKRKSRLAMDTTYNGGDV